MTSPTWEDTGPYGANGRRSDGWLVYWEPRVAACVMWRVANPRGETVCHDDDSVMEWKTRAEAADWVNQHTVDGWSLSHTKPEPADLSVLLPHLDWVDE